MINCNKDAKWFEKMSALLLNNFDDTFDGWMDKHYVRRNELPRKEFNLEFELWSVNNIGQKYPG